MSYEQQTIHHSPLTIHHSMNHKELDVWKLSVNFVVEIYNLTAKFPKEEQYGLVSQIRRAAVSVPSNIAEGAAKPSDKEFKRFLYIALGSTAEIETQIIISEKLSYINNTENYFSELNKIRKLIMGLINYLNNK